MIETLSNVRNRKSEKETNIINSSETLRTLGVKLSRISNDLTTEIYGSTKNKQLQRRATVRFFLLSLKFFLAFQYEKR